MIVSIIFLAIGFAMIVVGVKNYSSLIHIIKNGVDTEGIIFSSENSSSFNNVNINYPTVRFLTGNNEWITETSKISLSLGIHKRGEKVTVTYLPTDPRQFIIKSGYIKVISLLVILVGVAFLIIGIIRLLNI